MNRIKNIFRHKPSKKNSDELDRFIESKRANKENTKPTDKKDVDFVDNIATACYHTEVAPKTYRGTKSCFEGGSGGGHTNHSFETVVPNRRREANEYASTRQKRSGHTLSEYGGPSTKMSHFTYIEATIPSGDEDEEVNVQELKQKLVDMKRKNVYQLGRMQERKEFYKRELGKARAELAAAKDDLAEANADQKRNNRAFKALEEKYQKEVQHKDSEVQMLTTAVNNARRQCTTCNQHLMYPPFTHGSYVPSTSTSYPQSSNSYVQNFPSFSRAPTSNVIPDPQPTHNDLIPVPTMFNSARYANEDLDEKKHFQCRDDSMTSSSARGEIDLADMDY